MITLDKTCEELEKTGNSILICMGYDEERFSLRPPVGVADHYVFSGFLGETPVSFGINGRGNAIREYFPELLDVIKQHLTNPQ